MSLNLETGVEPVANYKLIRKLGQGGFGEVWEAEAPGGVRVALKFVRLDTAQAGPELRAVEVICNIRHPHLLDVQFAARVEDCLVVAMPLCDASLWDRFKECTKEGRPGLPLDELLRLMGELAEAVDFLNEPRHPAGDGRLVGVQHRDIKPQNVFLVGGSVRLADFGLAKILETSCAIHTGSMSPYYVAPEAVKGTVAPQSDQYSLAVTYCQLRTGTLPVTGNTISEIIYNHLNGTTDLSALPEEERPVVGRAMARDPGDRWPNCRSFVMGLEEAALRDDGRRTPETQPRSLESGTSMIDLVPSTEPQTGREIPTSRSSPFPVGKARWAARKAEARTSQRRWVLWAVLGGFGMALVGLAALFMHRGGAAAKSDRDTRARSGAAQTDAAQDTSKKRAAAVSQEKPVAAGQAKAVAAPPVAATMTRPARVQEKGAVAPPSGVEVVLAAILQDVRCLPPEVRPFARYFSLNHLLAAGATPEELELHRNALALAINHLSWQIELVQSKAIEPTRTIFRIDLRDLGWHQHPFERIVDGKAAGPSRLNLFDLALLEYPYGVVPEDSKTFDRLATEFLGRAEQVRPIPFIRADWFVSTATRPPLYEDFLELKEDAGRFARAIRKALGNTPAREPLIPVTKRFQQDPLPLPTAAAELGLPGPEDLRNVFRTPALTALGLSPLATEGSVRRDTWEESYDRVVRALGLGVPVVPLDALTRPDFRPDAVEFDVKLGTNKRNNVFAPGDELEIIVANPSSKDVFIELIGTGARGEKVILTPSATGVRAGQQYRFPPEGAIKVRGGLGRERITVFASTTEFPPGELLRGHHIVDRVVHRFPPAADRYSRILKRTIEVETR